MEAPKYPGQAVFDKSNRMNKMREVKPPLRRRRTTKHSRISPESLQERHQDHLQHDVLFEQNSEVHVLHFILLVLHDICELVLPVLDALDSRTSNSFSTSKVADTPILQASSSKLKKSICGSRMSDEVILVIHDAVRLCRMSSVIEASKLGRVASGVSISSIIGGLRDEFRALQESFNYQFLQRLTVVYAMPTGKMQNGICSLVKYIKKNRPSSYDIIAGHIYFTRRYFEELQRGFPYLVDEWKNCQQSLDQYMVEMMFDLHSKTTSRWSEDKVPTRDGGARRGGEIVTVDPRGIDDQGQPISCDELQGYVPTFDVNTFLSSSGWLYYGQALACDFNSYTRIFLSIAQRALTGPSFGDTCFVRLMMRLEQQMMVSQQVSLAMVDNASSGNTALATTLNMCSSDAGFARILEMDDPDSEYNLPKAQWTYGNIDHR